MTVVIEIGPNLRDVLYAVGALPWIAAAAYLTYRWVGLLVGIIE